MGKVIYSPGIDSVQGALDSEHKLITRLKHLRDTNGKVTKICAPEAYIQRNKRDFDQTPAIGKELAHMKHFGEASSRTKEIMKAYKSPQTATEQQLQLVTQYRQRFQAQIDGKPDPQAPYEKNGKQRRYSRFDNFIRAMVYQELKAEQ